MRAWSRCAGGSLVVTVGLVALASPAWAHDEAPARGAPLEDLWPATIVAAIATVVIVAVGLRHRRKPLGPLTALSDRSRRLSGLPGWAAVPLGMTTVSLLIAVF